MQFSLNGSLWKLVSNIVYYYIFNEMKSVDLIYVFFLSNFFKQMVNQGISDINIKDLFNFCFQNIILLEFGWYEFFIFNMLIIKFCDFSISIIFDEYIQILLWEGYVGSGELVLDFGYIVIISGKIVVDEVLIKVIGFVQVIGGCFYCVFSFDDGKVKVLFLVMFFFIICNGVIKIYDVGCDDSWWDMIDVLWLIILWIDIFGEVGQMDKIIVKFLILMDNVILLCMVDDNGWFGEVSVLGEIYVQVMWCNIN